MHVLLQTCDTDKFVFPFVVRTTFVKPWFIVEILYPVFSWEIFEHFPAFWQYVSCFPAYRHIILPPSAPRYSDDISRLGKQIEEEREDEERGWKEGKNTGIRKSKMERWSDKGTHFLLMLSKSYIGHVGYAYVPFSWGKWITLGDPPVVSYRLPWLACTRLHFR